MSALTIFLSGLWLTGAIWLIQQPPALTLSPPLLALGILGLLQECFSLRVRGFGLFTTAPSVYLASCLVPGGSARFAEIICAVSVGLRTLLKGDFDWSERCLEALADLIPVTVGLIFWQVSGIQADSWSSHLGGVAIWLALYAVTAWFIPMGIASTVSPAQLKDWNRFRHLVVGPLLAVVCLSPVLALMAQAGPWAILLLAPAFWVLQNAARSQSFRLDNLKLDQLWMEYSTSRRALHRSKEELDQTKVQLEFSAKEREVLEHLTRTLVQSRDLTGSVRTVGEAILSLIPADTIVVFLSLSEGETPVAGTLRAAWCVSPYRPQIEAASPGEPLEPCVETCFQSQVPVARSARDASRWFPGEQWGLAFPLEDQGVLYLGRRVTKALTEEEQTWLWMVTGQAALGIKSARRFSSLQEALHSQSVANQALHRWVQRLTILLEGARRLSESLDLAQLLDLTQGLLAPLVPHQGGWLLWQGEVRSRWPVGFGKGHAVEAILQAAVDIGRMLVVEDLSLDPPPGGQPSSGLLLVAPLWTREGAEGAILLWSSAPGAFDLEQQNLLNLVMLHLSAALSSASLHLKVVEAQAQMVQSSKLAAVGQLAAGIAHELNSPLGAVVLQLDAAQMRLSTRPELVPEKLRLAMEGVQKAQAIISKLLYYSREASVLMQPVDLNQVVNDTLQLSRAQIEIEGVSVMTKLGADANVYGNQNELQQVLTNLLLNARDSAIKAPDHRILASTGIDGTNVWLRITDLGAGVPPEIQERIFEPFFTTKEVGEGTGLGLYVSLEIMQRHSGKLLLEESTGRRTTFMMQLPRLTEGRGSVIDTPS